MITLTKEWLQKTIAELEEERDATPGAVNEDAANALAAMKLALASLEAEAVCVIDQSNLDYLKSGSDADVWPASRAEMGDVLLYRSAPPAPVALPSGYSDFEEIWSSSTHPLTQDDEMKDFAWDIWNACRAAMLQGAEPVNQNDELPLDYLQGHKDGLEWSAQLAEANHPQTGDWLYDDPIELARAIRKGPDMPTAQDGNSPVTPDGWIPVSERMPNDKDFVWCWGYVSGWTESDGFEAYYDATRNKWWTIDDETVRKVTHWMPLPAAPQQEVTQALVKGMERYGDAMQKLADSGD